MNDTTRPISVIAAEIAADWQPPSLYAVPYLQAMASLNKATDPYYADSAASIIRYFLANANSWRGEKAREIKKELKGLVKGIY